MAESLEPEGAGHRAQLRDKTSYRPEIHRVNDFVLGHVGQVSYKPLEEEHADANLGNLFSNRITEQREYWGLVAGL